MPLRTAPFLLLLLVVVASGAACDPNPTYDLKAHEFLATGGPKAACCTPPATVGQAIEACAIEAETKCAFIRNATFTTKKITEAGNAGRTVEIEVKGASGNGSCVVFVADHGKKNGGIRAENVRCNAVP